MSKRKPDSVHHAPSSPFRTVVPRSSNNQGASWESCQRQLSQLRVVGGKNDDALSALEAVQAAPEKRVASHHSSQLSNAESFLEDLQKQMARAEVSRQKAKAQQSQLQEEARELSSLKASLEIELEQLHEEERSRLEQISSYQLELREEYATAESAQAEQQREAPRLRHQISMYAACTGVKWDFEKRNFLAGEVNVVDQQGLKYFCLDPRKMTRFDIAHELWSLMDGSNATPVA